MKMKNCSNILAKQLKEKTARSSTELKAISDAQRWILGWQCGNQGSLNNILILGSSSEDGKKTPEYLLPKFFCKVDNKLFKV